MTSVANEILTAWYQLLNGNLSVGVFRGDAYSSSGDYVLIRFESEANAKNRASFVTSPVVVVEIVTKHDAYVNDSIAHDIHGDILTLVYDDPKTHNIVTPSFQVVTVEYGGVTELYEDDGNVRLHRLITRFNHRVKQ